MKLVAFSRQCALPDGVAGSLQAAEADGNPEQYDWLLWWPLAAPGTMVLRLICGALSFLKQVIAKTLAAARGNRWALQVDETALQVDETAADQAADQSVSQAELARLLGNIVPEDDLCLEEADQEALAREGARFLEVISGPDGKAALDAIRAASQAVVNYTDATKRTALMLAASEGHLEACKVVLARSDFKSVNERNSVGSTALHFAAANDEVEICKLLLESPRFTLGVNAVNQNGQSALDFCDFGDGDARQVLRAAGASPGQGRSQRQQFSPNEFDAYTQG